MARKIQWGNWYSLWMQYENLSELNHAYDNLEYVFTEIESQTGQMLLTTDRVHIQESLINRIEMISNPKFVSAIPRMALQFC